MSLSLPAALRLLLPDGTVKNILLEDYLRGVVAAALDAAAPLEAMKALAVAARTFAAHTHRHLERGADLCTTRHCQAWNERANPRAARAVMETRGIVATFNDQFIEAFYFEHCDGKTRDAAGVLVNAPAYLKSVACPCGFAALKGHGIGMCLRGMVAMARLGEAYAQILRHYYTGITLEQLGIDESTRVTIPVTPTKRATPAPKPTPRTAKTTPPPSAPPTAPAPREKTETPKPAPKPTPRRSTRPKIEHAPTDEETRKTPEPPAPIPFVAPRIEPRPEVEEADDFVSFLAVEDVERTTDDRRPTTDRRPQTPEIPRAPEKIEPPEKPISLDDALAMALKHDEPLLPKEEPSSFILPPSSFAAAPPLSMPEEFTPPYAAPPPRFDAGRFADGVGIGIYRAANGRAGRIRFRFCRAAYRAGH